MYEEAVPSVVACCVRKASEVQQATIFDVPDQTQNGVLHQNIVRVL